MILHRFTPKIGILGVYPIGTQKETRILYYVTLLLTDTSDWIEVRLMNYR